MNLKNQELLDKIINKINEEYKIRRKQFIDLFYQGEKIENENKNNCEFIDDMICEMARYKAVVDFFNIKNKEEYWRFGYDLLEFPSEAFEMFIQENFILRRLSEEIEFSSELLSDNLKFSLFSHSILEKIIYNKNN